MRSPASSANIGVRPTEDAFVRLEVEERSADLGLVARPTAASVFEMVAPATI